MSFSRTLASVCAAVSLAISGQAAELPNSTLSNAGSKHLANPASNLPIAASGIAITVAKVITCDDADTVFTPGRVLIDSKGRIEAVGPTAGAKALSIPEGYEEVEYPELWAYPGMIDLHTHIHTGSWGDINDMVRAANPELRCSPTFRPSNPDIRRACSSGVTTLFGIPGSGTSISGFGILYKSKTSASYAEATFADVGGMKVAQTHNPERGGGDLGSTRAGLSWLLSDINDKAIAAQSQGRKDWELENLMKVHNRELPVLMHCAGSDGVASAARMWGMTYPSRAVISHGSFDGHYIAPFVASLGMPVNHGPRTFNWRSGWVEERIVGTAKEYLDAGVPLFSLNTDSNVMPQEELFLQGSMSARLGADRYQMLRALTIHPAKSFGLEDRLGSLEAGKDADIVLSFGDLLDPRCAVERVYIEGRVEYDRTRDGQWF